MRLIRIVVYRCVTKIFFFYISTVRKECLHPKNELVLVSTKKIICDAKHQLSEGKCQKISTLLQLLTRCQPDPHYPPPPPPRYKRIFLDSRFGHIKSPHAHPKELDFLRKNFLTSHLGHQIPPPPYSLPE